VSADKLNDSAQPSVELLFELLRGPHGAVHLGRMLRGIDSGRLVTLREVGELDSEARAAMDVARSLAHPRLLKPLGLVSTPTTRYLASEYVPGASLLELGTAVRSSRFPLRPGVAVRIVKEALLAADVAQRLLTDTAGVAYARCLFSDTVWIAEFGDVLLTDVNVAPLLTQNPDKDAAKAAAKDLFAAGIELFQLVSGEAMSQEVVSKLGAYVPTQLAEVLEQALGLQGREPFTDIAGFVAALDDLPQALQASDQDLSDELRRRLGPTLEQRRNKLALLEVGAARQEESEDMTRVFQASSALQDKADTLRPDAPPDPLSPEALPNPLRAPADVVLNAALPVSVARALASDPGPVSAPAFASHPRKERLPRSFWLVAMLLIAVLSVAWWATSGSGRWWLPGSFTLTR
jgi:hypothetical protein